MEGNNFWSLMSIMMLIAIIVLFWLVFTTRREVKDLKCLYKNCCCTVEPCPVNDSDLLIDQDTGAVDSVALTQAVGQLTEAQKASILNQIEGGLNLCTDNTPTCEELVTQIEAIWNCDLSRIAADESVFSVDVKAACQPVPYTPEELRAVTVILMSMLLSAHLGTPETCTENVRILTGLLTPVHS